MTPEKVLSGMRITHSCRSLGIQNKDGWDHFAWKVQVKRGRKAFTVDYMMGLALKGEPSLVDVMESLILDADSASRMSFEEFMDEFGYPHEKPAQKVKARAIYTACLKNRKKLLHLFEDEELTTIYQAIENRY